MDAIPLKATAVFYLLATAWYVFYVVIRNTASRLPSVMLLCGFVAHTAAVAALFLQEGYPAVTALPDALLFMSWLMVAGYLLIQIRFPVPVLGCIVASLAFLMSLAALAAGTGAEAVPPPLKTFWLPLHVTLAFLGNAVFALAFGVSLIYLLQEHYVKQKKLTSMMKRVPPLEALDRLNYVLLVWGFPFMTLGILTGSMWAGVYWGDYWSWDPRQIASGLAWLFYGALLHARMTAGLRGRKAAVLTVVGFAVVLGYFLWGDSLFLSRHGGRFE
jgi:cytochrome c-type biogenesis protein CcsB